MKKFVTAALIPPIGACRYGCGTKCAPPISVFWLFGVIGVVFGLLGGPAGGPGISWGTVLLGLAMWAIAAVWTILTIQGVDQDRCHGMWSPKDHQVKPDAKEIDPFEEIKKAH